MADNFINSVDTHLYGPDPNLSYIHQQVLDLKHGDKIFIFHSDRKREIDLRLKEKGIKIIFTVVMETRSAYKGLVDHWIYERRYK